MQLVPLQGGVTLDTGHRAGFFLGDGAGVGKGRQVAGLIYEHRRCGGKRVLWQGCTR
jgi:hypothetical protein